ncbi:N-acetyltransferase [Sphingomonas sp. 2R-10]|uniref:GNAT family N-acetyltransferase n=1 Tax=Sphingomonas sp. 2R-10 TaxID=3045148 RepID=UPI000F776F94|nr:N-acetyltransferase [Sphingomonas sp. 2R-10]MDJ0278334.1 N-acetyltransferase [Sphingomonas sp. 2R-10]
MSVIRAATGADAPAVDALLRACFPRDAEARLVQQLAIDGDLVLVLVAEDDGAVIGMVAASRMHVTADTREIAAVAIAPLAVDRVARGQGVGEALVAAAIAHLRGAGVELGFVLGDPAYYGRFGFEAATAHGFDSPYAGDYLLGIRLNDGPCVHTPGAATHAWAFAALGEDA